jgi:Zn-dependent alcohol dehydrogenase
MTKDSVIEVINKMPEDFDLDTLVQRLIFIEKVNEGLDQIDEGKGIPLEEVKQLVKQWQK